jgi:hypothetical protein
MAAEVVTTITIGGLSMKEGPGSCSTKRLAS